MYKDLEGKFVNKIYKFSDDMLLFVCDDGNGYWLETESECCSSTWIEHIEGVDNLINATIISVEDIDMPDLGSPNTTHDEEYIQYYGLKITTTKGSAQFDYRNSSNGYYGGNIRIFEANKEAVANLQDNEELTEDF